MKRHNAVGLVLLFASGCRDTPMSVRPSSVAPVTLERIGSGRVPSAAENALIERIVADVPAQYRQVWADKLRSGLATIDVPGNPTVQVLIDSLHTLREAGPGGGVQVSALARPGALAAPARVEEAVVALVASLPERDAKAVVLRRREPQSSIILVTNATTNADLKHAIAALVQTRQQEPASTRTERRITIYAPAGGNRRANERDIIDWRELKAAHSVDLAGVGPAKTIVIRLKA